jgi:xylitol oxidase
MQNWAGSYTYQAARVEQPTNAAEVAAIVRAADRVHAVGTRHCFNAIADAPGGVLISTERLTRVVSLDTAGPTPTVTIEPGVTYGQLGPVLHAAGWALPNLASLPHISVAGSVATATHGSGERLGCLSTSVSAMDLVTADGTTRTLHRGDADFAGAVVHLGVLGVVTRLTLDLVPAFDVAQTVYDGVPMAAFVEHVDAVVGSAYSVSAFTDWQSGTLTQVWMKSLVGTPHFDLRTLGGRPADGPRHPLEAKPGNLASGGRGTDAATAQHGVPGPRHERLPHFRPDFTPSSGAELQTEYFVPRGRAAEALAAVAELGDAIGPALQITEVRFVAADDLWMSMCYGRPSVGVHFTWRKEPAAVAALLPRIERALAPFDARPHWGKLFVEDGPLAERRDPAGLRFRELMRRYDPTSKFGSTYLR